MVVEPRVGGSQRPGIDEARGVPARYFPAQPADALPPHHLLGNGIQRNGKRLGNLVDCGWMFGTRPQNRAARGIAERRKDTVEFTSLVIFTHMDEYYLQRS